jgi:transcription elongation factor Elf1
MQDLNATSLQCPYCGESIEVLVDCSVDEQTYIEDCGVCCRPIVMTVLAEGGELLSIEARSEDE